MLLISTPDCCKSEQYYIIKLVLEEFLGIPCEIKIHSKKNIIIECLGYTNKLFIDASFFLDAELAWLKKTSMPKLPLSTWNIHSSGLKNNKITTDLPVLYGKPKLVKNGSDWYLDIDIFGSIFFMLSRYEELVSNERDLHGRFPATASVAQKSNFLDFPIVDQYTEILWTCLSDSWFNLKRKKIKAKKFITCDVDWPFDPTLDSLEKAIKNMLFQLFKQKQVILSFSILFNFLRNKFGFKVEDRNEEAIKWIMEINEKEGNKVSFFFITYKTSHLDTNENFDSKKIRSLIRSISERGHNIGLHPGYETFNNRCNFSRSIKKLNQILKEENINQTELGGRQHFLRWDVAKTPHLWEEHELTYDSTLAFADCAGFRCGTSREFTMYDLVNRKPFKLKQRPLVSMECSIISKRYEGLGYTKKAKERFLHFKKQTEKYGGVYTLLWHNSHFTLKNDTVFYKELIK